MTYVEMPLLKHSWLKKWHYSEKVRLAKGFVTAWRNNEWKQKKLEIFITLVGGISITLVRLLFILNNKKTFPIAYSHVQMSFNKSYEGGDPFSFYIYPSFYTSCAFSILTSPHLAKTLRKPTKFTSCIHAKYTF